MNRNIAIAISRAFHETGESFSGPAAMAVPWDEVPIAHRAHMANVMTDLIDKGIIVPGKSVLEAQA